MQKYIGYYTVARGYEFYVQVFYFLFFQHIYFFCTRKEIIFFIFSTYIFCSSGKNNISLARCAQL